jgi:hypothetical protein
MSDADLRAILEAAKAYKAEQISVAESQVNEARQVLATAEARLEQWKQMIPHEVQSVMAEAARREKAYRADLDEKAEQEAQHSAALAEAYAKGKALLPPEWSSKSNSFGMVGALLFGGIAALVLGAVFHVHDEVWLLVASGGAAVLGLFAGFAVFDANFVVDESLERDVFARFTASETVRRTFFKGPGSK